MLDEPKQELYYALAAARAGVAARASVRVGEGVAGWSPEHGETLIVPET